MSDYEYIAAVFGHLNATHDDIIFVWAPGTHTTSAWEQVLSNPIPGKTNTDYVVVSGMPDISDCFHPDTGELTHTVIAQWRMSEDNPEPAMEALADEYGLVVSWHGTYDDALLISGIQWRNPLLVPQVRPAPARSRASIRQTLYGGVR